MLVLTRPTTAAAADPVLDASQRAAVLAPGPVLRVVGAPGTGTSTVAVERVVRAVRGGLAADSCLLLAPTRLAAARLRDADGFAVLGSAAAADTSKMEAAGVKCAVIEGADLVVIAVPNGLLIAPRALDRETLKRAAESL